MKSKRTIKDWKSFNESTDINVDNIYEKAKELLEENISKEFIRTDMGSGWMLTLRSPFNGDVLDKMKYLDMYEGEDNEADYEAWKEELMYSSIEQFKEKVTPIHLDDFVEYLQRDTDDNF